MPDRKLVSIPYEYSARLLLKGRREPQWYVGTRLVQGLLREVAEEEAPVAATFTPDRDVDDVVETYRAFEGGLYRELDWDGEHLRPLMADELVDPSIRLWDRIKATAPRATRLPRRQQEQVSSTLMPGAQIKETFEDRSDEAEPRASRHLARMIVVEGRVHAPCPPPMIALASRGRLGVVPGAALDREDPEMVKTSFSYTTLFGIGRWDDAAACARLMFAESLRRGEVMGEWREDLAPAPGFELRADDRYAQLVFRDDMVASARYGLAFPCSYLAKNLGALDNAGIMAFGRMREAVEALDHAEGATRGNARRAYAAAGEMLAAGAGSWMAPAESAAFVQGVGHVLFPAAVRSDFDETFRLRPEETFGAEDEAAIGSFAL